MLLILLMEFVIVSFDILLTFWTVGAFISSWPFVKKLRGSDRKVFVFIQPPGISHGAFELRMDNVWFCKVLLLFQVESKTDLDWKKHSCAFISVMEEYAGPQRPGVLLSLLRILSTLM